MINWLKDLLEEKSTLWWLSVSTVMLLVFLVFVNQSSEKDLFGFLTGSTFYTIEKEKSIPEVEEKGISIPLLEERAEIKEVGKKEVEEKDDVIKSMVRIIEEREMELSSSDDFIITEEGGGVEDLGTVKDSFVPRLSKMLNSAFNFEKCVNNMSLAVKLTEDSLINTKEEKINEVCSESDVRKEKLEKDIDNINNSETIEEFNTLFNQFFEDLDSSSNSFNNFVKSETSKLITLIEEELKRIEKEKYSIKMPEGLSGDLECVDVDGMSVFGYSKGKYIFIGSITNSEDTNSINSSGSKLKPLSISNRSGIYGSDDSNFSAFARDAATPPVIINEDYQFISYITQNKDKEPSITPYKALYCTEESINYSLPGHEELSLFGW